VDTIKKYIGDGEKEVDSVGYFKLLVKTEISYQLRLIARIPPLLCLAQMG
jgi:hypothetical protein